MTTFRHDLPYRNQNAMQQQDKRRRADQGYNDFTPDTSESVDNSETSTDAPVDEQDPTI